MARPDALGLEHGRRKNRLVLVDVQQLDAVADELREVLVARDHADPEVRVLCNQPAHQRGDDVVGFDAGLADHGNPHRTQDLQAAIDLGSKIIRRLRAIRLVLRVQLAAERLPVAADIDDHREVLRLVVPYQLEQDPGEAERHVRGLPGHGARHARTYRVVRPEELGVAVDQVERAGVFHAGGHDPPVTSGTPLPGCVASRARALGCRYLNGNLRSRSASGRRVP